MSKLKFEPCWFSKVVEDESIVEIAQARFDEWLKEQKVVYGYLAGNTEMMYGPNKHNDSTHKAYLVGVEPIKKEPCKHEPRRAQLNFEGGGSREWIQPTCAHCGAKLRPVFEVVE